VSTWDADTRLALAVYDRVCPWGEVIYPALPQAMDDLNVPTTKRRLLRRLIPAIERAIKKIKTPPAATT